MVGSEFMFRPSMARFISMTMMMMTVTPICAFVPGSVPPGSSPVRATEVKAIIDDEMQMDRRGFVVDRILVGSGMILSSSSFLFGVDPAVAAPAKKKKINAALESDRTKVLMGYDRLQYLLDNWEKETTVCKRNDNPYIGCERTPEKVMEYLGYKSMEDPLFRADKTLMRLQALVPDDDPVKQARYQDAVDIWMEKAEEGNGMAFISSWGEANPGGGKDRVALFIERSKKDVIEAKDCLNTVIEILNLREA